MLECVTLKHISYFEALESFQGVRVGDARRLKRIKAVIV